jgi:hypothetical protein
MADNFSEIVSNKTFRQSLAAGCWTGWVWDGKSWCRVCTGEGLGDTAALLSQKADARKVKDSHTCLTRGDRPASPPPGR